MNTEDRELLERAKLELRLVRGLVDKHNQKRGPTVSPADYDAKQNCRLAVVYVVPHWGARTELYAIGTMGQLLHFRCLWGNTLQVTGYEPLPLELEQRFTNFDGFVSRYDKLDESSLTVKDGAVSHAAFSRFVSRYLAAYDAELMKQQDSAASVLQSPELLALLRSAARSGVVAALDSSHLRYRRSAPDNEKPRPQACITFLSPTTANVNLNECSTEQLRSQFARVLSRPSQTASMLHN